MTREITRVLEELRKDHTNMGFLLDLIEREAGLIRGGHSADFALLHDAMHYMTMYPDAVHHPKEDRLYNEMRLERSDLTTGFERISMDHRSIAEQGKKLRDDFSAVDSGAIVSRVRLADEAMRYVDTMRSHMQWEEIDLFERCKAMAVAGHRFIVHADPDEVDDPLFGDKPDDRYARIFASIRSAAKQSA